jgi:hypothetical protein
MTPRAGMWMRRVKKLALAGALIAAAATFALITVSTWWLWVAAGCTEALALLVVIADVAERSAVGGDGAAPSRAGTRMRRVKNLARAGMWIVLTAEFALQVSVSPGWWLWVATGCAVALAVLSIIADVAERIAAVAELEAGGRQGGWRRKGSGLSGHGRDDDGPAGEAAHRWRTLAVVSLLMPASAGRRWLAEAESLLAEVAAARRGAAVRSYLLSAPRLAVMMWAREIFRQRRPGRRRPG